MERIAFAADGGKRDRSVLGVERKEQKISNRCFERPGHGRRISYGAMEWKDHQRRRASSGMYFCRMQAKSFNKTIKMMLLP